MSAALRCIGRWGVAKSTLDDIAREAGCSRATLYRLVPGGKAALLERVARSELQRLLASLESVIGEAATLHDALSGGLCATSAFINESEALRTIVAHEPELVLSFLAFDRLDPILAASAEVLGPQLERFVDASLAAELIEWCARLVFSYVLEPSAFVDLARPDHIEALVSAYLMPGIEAADAALVRC